MLRNTTAFFQNRRYGALVCNRLLPISFRDRSQSVNYVRSIYECLYGLLHGVGDLVY